MAKPWKKLHEGCSGVLGCVFFVGAVLTLCASQAWRNRHSRTRRLAAPKRFLTQAPSKVTKVNEAQAAILIQPIESLFPEVTGNRIHKTARTRLINALHSYGLRHVLDFFATERGLAVLAGTLQGFTTHKGCRGHRRAQVIQALSTAGLPPGTHTTEETKAYARAQIQRAGRKG